MKLIKAMEYERIDCTCGMAVLPKDPTPEITLSMKKLAIQEDVQFFIVDVSMHPEVMNKYDIRELPAVIIGKKAYKIDEKMIRDAIKKEKYDRR
jgi:hypothetical protein